VRPPAARCEVRGRRQTGGIERSRTALSANWGATVYRAGQRRLEKAAGALKVSWGVFSLRNQPTKTSGSRCGASSLKFQASSFPGRTPPVERAVSLSNCCFRSGRRRRFRFSEIRLGANHGGAGAAGLMDTLLGTSRVNQISVNGGLPGSSLAVGLHRIYIEQIAAMRAGGDSQGRPLGARIRQRRRAALIGEFQLRGGHRQGAALKDQQFWGVIFGLPRVPPWRVSSRSALE